MTIRGLLSLGRRIVPLAKERAIRDRLDLEVTRLSRRALDFAESLLLKAPRLEPSEGFEVRPVEEGWMIFEKASTLPVKLHVRKADAVKAARELAAPFGAKVKVFKKPRVPVLSEPPSLS